MENKMDNAKPKFKRSLKNYWLNPSYQGRYIFWISMTGLALVALNSSVFYYFTKENYSLLVDLSPMTDEAKNQLYKELKQIIAYLVSGNLVFLAVCAFLGLLFSHRTVGPMYHFKRVFKEIQAGKTSTRVRLRPKDDFKDVAQGFNDMMDSLEKSKK